MSSVVNNPVLTTFGIGRFYEAADRETVLTLSVANVAGWIPAVSIIAGLARCILGVAFLVSKADTTEGRVICGIQIVRGLAEICCVGFLAAPVDLVVTAVRLVRDYYNSRSSEEVG